MLSTTQAVDTSEMSTFRGGAHSSGQASGSAFLVDIIDEIRGGTYSKKVGKVRAEAKKERNGEAHKRAKGALPSFTVSGTFNNRRKGFPDAHSGLLQVDLDGKDNPGLTVDKLRARVKDHPSLVACFMSPSGDGLKLVVRIGVADDTADHKRRFRSVKAEMKRLGLTVDDSCSDPARLCFYSHDPDAFYRSPDEAKPFPLFSEKEEEVFLLPEGQGEGIHHPLPVAKRALEAIAEKVGRPDYLRWLELTAAMTNSYGADGLDTMKEVFPEEEEEEYEAKLRYLPKAHNAGHVFNKAKELADWDATPEEKEALNERLKKNAMEAANEMPLDSFKVDHESTVGFSIEEIEALRPPIIIDGFLRQGEVMLLGAESKSRKSWLAQDAGISVASGLPWLPDEISDFDELSPEDILAQGKGFRTEQGAVHVFDLELAGSEVKYRFAKTRENRLPSNLRAQRRLSQSFHSYSLEGEPSLAILAHLTELERKVQPGDLVIVDCLYRLQADGNEVEEVARIFERLKRFAKQTKAGVTLVDHFRKAGAEKARDRFAGSFVKQASASTLVAIESKGGDVLEMSIDARTFHGLNRVHTRFNLERYLFERIPEEDVKAEHEAKKRSEQEGWLAQVWKSKNIDALAGNADGEKKWGISRQATTTRFGKLVKAGFVAIVESGRGKATKWALTDQGREVLTPYRDLHPNLHPATQSP